MGLRTGEFAYLSFNENNSTFNLSRAITNSCEYYNDQYDFDRDGVNDIVRIEVEASRLTDPKTDSNGATYQTKEYDAQAACRALDDYEYLRLVIYKGVDYGDGPVQSENFLMQKPFTTTTLTPEIDGEDTVTLPPVLEITPFYDEEFGAMLLSAYVYRNSISSGNDVTFEYEKVILDVNDVLCD